MMKIADLFSGSQTLAVAYSKYNGEIKVIRDLAWGTYIKVNGLTQSGGVVKNIWAKTLKEILKEKSHIDNCLILGLGGGSAALIVSSYWVGAQIVGVDIDEEIVKLGKKYLGLKAAEVEIKIDDAFKFVENSLLKRDQKYNLILVDLYCGDEFPEKFESIKFLSGVKKLISDRGSVVFNRLYGGDKRSDSIKFAKKLEKIFGKVDYFYPQANLELICYN